jgi:hypothetical protein
MALAMFVAPVVFAQIPDSERGRTLYENHCQVCHTSAVHARVNRIAMTRTEVRQLVENWQSQGKLGWSADDINDVVDFLSRTKYHFQ